MLNKVKARILVIIAIFVGIDDLPVFTDLCVKVTEPIILEAVEGLAHRIPLTVTSADEFHVARVTSRAYAISVTVLLIVKYEGAVVDHIRVAVTIGIQVVIATFETGIQDVFTVVEAGKG